MLRIYSAVALLAIAGAAFAQTSTAPATPPSTTPSVTPSETPAVTPSQTPAVTPSQTPAITSSPSTTIPGPITPPSAVGGLSKCENMIGTDKDTCRQQERAGTGGTMSTPGTTSTPAAPATGTVR